MKESLLKLGEKRIDSVSLLIQFVLLSSIFILMVASLFVPFFIVIIQYLISFLLFIMSYNNSKYFHRKYFTIIYAGAGFFFLIFLWLGW